MLNRNSDAAVVGRVLAGRRDDFGILVERHLPAVFAVAYGRTGNHADAEDAAQEAFLRALKTLDRLREPAKFGPWLLTIARNVATDILIARTRERNAGSPISDEDDAVWLPNMEQREMWSKLHEQIRQLEDEPREVLMLFYFAGKRTKEIAALLNLSNDVVRKRLQRARETLGARLLDELQPERKLEPILQKRSAAITAAALTAPVAWQSASAATVSAGVGLALGKWFAGAVLVLAVGVAGIAFLKFEREPTNVPPRAEPVYASLPNGEPYPAQETAGQPSANDYAIERMIDPSAVSVSAVLDALVLHGRVVDGRTGKGVSLGVTLTSQTNPQSESYYPCDADGRFSLDFSDFDYGAYLISCRNYNYYPFATALVQHTGGPFEEVVLEVNELATVSGRVLRPDGSPVPNAAIMRWELAGNIDTAGSADGQGNYKLHHEGGTLALAARHGMLWSEREDFALDKDQSVTHDFVLPESGEIHIVLKTTDGGDVHDISDSVLTTDAVTAPYLLAEPLGENEFIVRDLPFDTFTIVVRAAGYDPAEIAAIRIDASSPAASVKATLRPGQSFEVTVRVIDPNGDPLPDAGVVLELLTERLDAEGNVQAGLRNQVGANGKNTNDRGEWSASGLPRGTYRAYCNDVAGNGETYLSIPEDRVATIRLTKREFLQYTIQLVDALDNNKPLSPVDARFFVVQDDSVVAGVLGPIADGITAGTNHLIVVKEGYTAYLDTIVAMRGDEQVNIEAPLGEGGTVEGRILNADGSPRPLEPLYVFPELLWPFALENWPDLHSNGPWKDLGRTLGQRAQTDAAGSFSIDHLPQGRYVVVIIDGTVSDPVDTIPGMVTGPVEIVAK
ncbi:MAG: hypothetical protein AMXMBFR82_47470 [Candidatus Hydrogenedentota bacterium]